MGVTKKSTGCPLVGVRAVIGSVPGNFLRMPGLFWAALVGCALAFGPPAALAQSEKPQFGTADEEFSKQLSELKRTFADLSKKFEDSAQTIDRLNSAEAARKEIEELREHVGRLLGAVADNGTVWSLGTKALRRADEKLKALETETRYKEEDRQFLIARWRELKAATEDAIKELEGARKEFAELLRKLQTNEDFIEELLQIQEHQRAIEVIHNLSEGIRDASDKLKKLLSAIKTPGA
jgi:DNA repair exonuclease SbcCD ATPase subunit